MKLAGKARWILEWIRHQSAQGVIDHGLDEHHRGSDMNRNSNSQSAGQMIGLISGQQVVGLDIAKSVFQLHSVDMGTGEIVNMQLKRAKVLEYFANHQPCLIGIEACGGSMPKRCAPLFRATRPMRQMPGRSGWRCSNRAPSLWGSRAKSSKPPWCCTANASCS